MNTELMDNVLMMCAAEVALTDVSFKYVEMLKEKFCKPAKTSFPQKLH